MIEDGHPHVILAHQDTPVLHLHATQDLIPEAVNILLPQNEGITQGMEWSQSLLTLISSYNLT